MKEEIRKLFPVKVKITKKMIDKSDIFNPKNCIGYHTLKKVVKKFDVVWGLSVGFVSFSDYNVLTITSKENLNFIDITKPCTVTLIVKEI
jgi:aromatic ring-opening dioxygenase LigB subunit